MDVDPSHLSLAEKVLSDETFVRAPRIQRFLRYILECSFEGRSDELTEQQVGVQVFDRPAHYNPGDDNVVRSSARLLRKRLEGYFETTGADQELIIEVPRGGYAPVFRRRNVHLSTPAVPVKHTEQVTEPVATVQQSPTQTNVRGFFFLVALLMVLAAGLGFAPGRRKPASSTENLRAFWNAFSGSRPTRLIASDTSLTETLGLTRKSISIPEYVTGSYITNAVASGALPEGWGSTSVHRYSDLMDVKLISQIARLPEMSKDTVTVGYARDLHTDDLRQGNLVLLGGSNGNPWVTVFDPSLNYSLTFLPEQRSFLVVNKKPLPGEEKSFLYGPDNWTTVSYGLLALRPNLNGSGSVLLIEGVAAAGMESAAQYVLEEDKLKWLLQRIRKPDGSLHHFELLLRTQNVGANATTTDVVGFRKSE